MNEEVSQAIRRNPRANPNAKVTSCHGPRNDAARTRDSKNQEEGIVFFKKTRLVDVMILMKIPHQSMHEILVREPRYTLHNQEGCNHNEYGVREENQTVHGKTLSRMKNAAKMRTKIPVPLDSVDCLGTK